MKSNILFIFCAVFFTACQVPDQAVQQQQAVCKTLSQGYLKIHNQQNYEFWRLEKIETQAAHNTLKLTYKQPTENGMMMSGLHLPMVEFLCSQQQQHVMLSLQQTTGPALQVLELELAQAAIGKLRIHD